ncbi:hypothetical protein [Tautonia rosea]|uniref:hypothetical protein n=1 Tax=Tautonia rosea TaxID=2728037 RepID=UPI0014767FEB|nr:hypothetical protein [Tautonia rosea]
MSLTLPFWVGALILILPATIMVLAVVGALPTWSGYILFLILFSLPVPAAAWTIGNGFHALRVSHQPAVLDQRSNRAIGTIRSWWTSISALVSILLGLLVITASLTMLGWFLLKLLVFG